MVPNIYIKFVDNLSSTSKVKLWLVMICFLALFGCASSHPALNQELPCPLFENSDSVSIAVLPFIDKTGNNGIAKLVRDAFYCQLSVRRYRDIELHVVDRILEAHDLSDSDVLYKSSIKELGRLLNSDALVIGEITTYQKLFLGVYSQMAVGATITVWDSKSGQIVWSDRHVARLHEGGVPFSLVELPFISFRSGYNLRESVKTRTVDELSRYLISRIPDPVSSLYTSQVNKSCPEDETEITNSEITARQQQLSEDVGGQNDTTPPMF